MLRYALFGAFCFIQFFAASESKADDVGYQQAKAVCDFIKDPPNGNLLQYTQEKGWLDANNDSDIDYVDFEVMGTAGFKYLRINNNEKPIQFSGNYEVSNEHMQWLNYKGRTYLINLQDWKGQYPTDVYYLSSKNVFQKVCSFKHTLTNGYMQDILDNNKVVLSKRELCQKAQNREIRTYIKPVQLKEVVNLGNETHARSYVMVDVLNDGVKRKILNAEYASGRGAGCDYYIAVPDTDLVNAPKGLQLLKEKQRKICQSYSNPRFFTHEGKTYFEQGDSRGNLRAARVSSDKASILRARDADALNHEIWLFTKDKAEQICLGRIGVKSTYTINKGK